MALRVLERIPVPVPGDGAPGTLNVTYVKQEQDNWCWAACCQMVFGLLNFTVNGGALRQCDMASSQFNASCCNSPSSSVCDQGCWPENAYNFYGINFIKTNSALSPAGVKAEIDAGRPAEVYFAWTNGGAHVALVVGYYENGDLEVYDPYYGPSRHAYSDLLSAYSMGSWTISYSSLRI